MKWYKGIGKDVGDIAQGIQWRMGERNLGEGDKGSVAKTEKLGHSIPGTQ